MKKVLIAVVLLVLVGCAAALIITYRSLGTTQGELQETKTSLNETQVKLQDTMKGLEETQHELLDTTKNLAETQQSLAETQQSLTETQQSLNEQKGQTETYLQLYESSLKELQNREQTIDRLTEKYTVSQQANEDLQKTIDEIKSKIKLYEDTLGVKVFSGVMPPYGSGNVSSIILTNQSTAENPTWKNLEAFLKEDKTDKNIYVPGVYECGNYAQELHNNAEAKGIRAAFVTVHLYDERPHALNAFKTLDKGLVYIDVTGSTKPVYLANLDKKVILEKDKQYHSSLLFPDGWYVTQERMIIKSVEIYW
jgi:Sec-independent protein translocase protein TatA